MSRAELTCCGFLGQPGIRPTIYAHLDSAQGLVQQSLRACAVFSGRPREIQYQRAHHVAQSNVHSCETFLRLPAQAFGPLMVRRYEDAPGERLLLRSRA